MPASTAATIAHSGRGPFAVLRRAKNIKNASEPERDALLEDAERIETWCAWFVLFAVALEAISWVSPISMWWFDAANFTADAIVGVGIYGEMRFGHVVGNILKIRLAEAVERAAIAESYAADARKRTAEIEQLTAWRRLSPETKEKLIATVRDKASEIDLLVEYEGGDPEAYSYAHELIRAFFAAGVMKIRQTGNSFIGGGIFGVLVSAAEPVDIVSIMEVFADSNVPMKRWDTDLSTHLGRGPTRQTYIFLCVRSPRR